MSAQPRGQLRLPLVLRLVPILTGLVVGTICASLCLASFPEHSSFTLLIATLIVAPGLLYVSFRTPKDSFISTETALPNKMVMDKVLERYTQRWTPIGVLCGFGLRTLLAALRVPLEFATIVRVYEFVFYSAYSVWIQFIVILIIAMYMFTRLRRRR